MTSIDQRIVEMKFNNSQFEDGVRESMGTLDRLKQALRFDGAEKSLSDIQTAAQNFSLSGMEAGVESLEYRFSTLGIIGMTVIQDLTSSAMSMGKKVTSYVTDAFFAGGKRRAQNIETARFQLTGLGMDVEEVMRNALYAVTDTAYGLDEAARVAGQLGASGVQAGEDMAKALRAISGTAAMTNSSYDDMGRIFATVAGNGRLMGMQLTQLGSKGLNAAAVMAKAWGTTEEAVRKMASNGAISFEMFYKAMDDAFGEHATKANETYAGSLANVRANLAKIGEDVYITHFENMKRIFNALLPQIKLLRNLLLPFITQYNEESTIVYNKFADWIESVNIEPIVSALEGTKNVIVGLAAVLDIFRYAFVKVAALLIEGAKMFIPVGESALSLTARFSEFALSLRRVIVEGDLLGKFFDSALKWLAPVGAIVQKAVNAISAALGKLSGSDTQAVKDLGDTVTNSFKPLGAISQLILSAFGVVKLVIEKTIPLFLAFGKAASKGLGHAQNALMSWMSGLDLTQGLDIFNAGIFAAFLLALRKMTDGMSKIVNNAAGVTSSLKGIFTGVTDTFKAMQESLRADALMKIATAIGVLTASVLVISTIDQGKLTTSLLAMGVMFGELIAALVVFEKVVSGPGLMTVMKSVPLMIALSTAVLMLSGALKIIASIELDKIIAGLIGMGGVLAQLLIALKFMPAQTGLIQGSVAIIALSAGLIIMAQALKQISSLDVDSMTNGLKGLGKMLLSLSLFLNFTNFSQMGAAKGLGILLLASSLVVLAKALKMFTELDLNKIQKSLTEMGKVLAGVGLFLKSTSNLSGSVPTAMALVVLGGAMIVFAKAIERFNTLDWEETKRGMMIFTGTLGILAVTMNALKGTSFIGAAGLLVLANAMLVLVPTLKILGGMSLGSIAKALIALAGTFGVLGIAAMALAPAIPTLFALSGILLAIGVSVGAVGAGIALLATGMTTLAVAGAGGIGTLTMTLTAFMGLIPMMIKQFANGLVAFLEIFSRSGRVILETVRMILVNVSGAIVESAPQLIKAARVLIKELLEAIVELAPKFIQAGFVVINSFLEGIRDNIGQVVALAVDIMINFIESVVSKMDDLVQAGIDLLVGFINGMAEGVRKNTDAILDAVFNLALAIIETIASTLIKSIDAIKNAGVIIINGLIDGMKAVVGGIYTLAKQIPERMIAAMRDFVDKFIQLGMDLILGIKEGIEKGASHAINAAIDVAKRALEAAKSFLGVSSPSKAFAEVGKFSAQGFAEGMLKHGALATDAAQHIGESSMKALGRAVDKINDILQSSDLDPVIKPILDLDELEDDLDSIFRDDDKVFQVNQSRRLSQEVSKYGRKALSIVPDKGDRGGDDHITNEFTVTAVIREESDIRRVAQELYNLQQRAGRGRGLANAF